MPFFFRIHGSPNDYFRYTDQSIIKALKEIGFKEIKVKIIGGGIFMSFYSSFSLITNKIPFLNLLLFNNFLLIFCQILDGIISLFSKNIKSMLPLGYFFEGRK